MIICVDFDGTIVENNFPYIGAEKPGAIEALKALQKQHCIILWTCREGEHLINALAALKDRGFVPDYVNENDKAFLAQSGFGDTRKVYAHLYVDDSAKRFNGWDEIMDDFEESIK